MGSSKTADIVKLAHLLVKRSGVIVMVYDYVVGVSAVCQTSKKCYRMLGFLP